MATKIQAAKTIAAVKIGHMLDSMIVALELKNDAALARTMDVAPPIVSKLRAGVLPFGPVYIIRCHELTGWSIAEIKAQLPIAEKRKAA